MRLIAGLLLIVWGSQWCGCSPRTASILVRDDPKPKIDHMEFNNRYHRIRTIYTLAEFRHALENERISKVEVVTLSGHEISSERMALAPATADSVFCFGKDGPVAVALDQVEKVVIYERIPSREKTQQFLVQAIMWPMMAIGLQLGNGDDFRWNRVGNSAGIGVALGSIFLARDHRVTEKVMFILERPLD